MKTSICPFCNKEITNNNYKKHLKSHELHPEYQDSLNKSISISADNNYHCRYCNKLFISAKSAVSHENLCILNPNHKQSGFVEYNKKVNYKPWNKGLTKETDTRVAKQADSLKNYYTINDAYWTNKNLSEETKQQISKSRQIYLSEHPDQVPYLLNHSSKISYPEQYFIDLFFAENIKLKYHFQVSKYQLDFYNEELKIDLEVDGEQHYLDDKIYQSDRRRDAYLTKLGWKIYRIRWADYKKLSLNKKQQIIDEIKQLF